MRRCEAALRRRRVRLRGTEREEGKEGANEAPHRKEKLRGWLNSTRRLRNGGAASDSELDSAPMVAPLGLGFVRVERRPRIWGTEGRRRLLFIGRMRSASTGDAACGHKTRARTRVRLEEGGDPNRWGLPVGGSKRGERRSGPCAELGREKQKRAAVKGG